MTNKTKKDKKGQNKKEDGLYKNRTVLYKIGHLVTLIMEITSLNTYVLLS